MSLITICALLSRLFAIRYTPIPAPKEIDLSSIRYAADRCHDTIKFTDEALKTVLAVPRVFLPLVLKGCVSWALENNVELITEEHMKIINDKRSKEKTDKKKKK